MLEQRRKEKYLCVESFSKKRSKDCGSGYVPCPTVRKVIFGAWKDRTNVSKH
jgi:hypothetical protein